MLSNQISGPDWLAIERYDIEAKVPAGTTPDQFSLMLQQMIEERFALKLHHSAEPAAAGEKSMR